MRNQCIFAHCASSQFTNRLSNCPSKKCSLISGPWIPISSQMLSRTRQEGLIGGKIWRWIFQRSNDRGSVPLPLGSLLIVLAEQTCARFSGGPRKCYIIVACNHFATENWWLWMAIKGDMIFIRLYQKVFSRKLSTKDENTRLTMTCWRYAGIIALVGS